MNKFEAMKADKDGLDVWPDLLRYAAENVPIADIPEDELNRSLEVAHPVINDHRIDRFRTEDFQTLLAGVGGKHAMACSLKQHLPQHELLFLVIDNQHCCVASHFNDCTG